MTNKPLTIDQVINRIEKIIQKSDDNRVIDMLEDLADGLYNNGIRGVIIGYE